MCPEAGVSFWRCDVANLSPNTEYSVRVSTNGGSAEASLQTLAGPGTDLPAGLGSKRVRFGVLSDVHVNLRGGNGKRLYGAANQLFERYLGKLASDHSVEFVILPGDVADTGSDGELHEAQRILSTSSVPCYPIIGNHEYDPDKFNQVLLPSHPKGYYSFDANRVHFVMLATNEQSDLGPHDAQLAWLREDLQQSLKESDICLVFMHYSLMLHPLHNNGRWDDGLQVLYSASEVLKILHSFPHVKAVICGHKNVPSMLVDGAGVLHTLSPQLIQVPCGYDVWEIFDGGISRSCWDIEDQGLQLISRRAAGDAEFWQRRGIDEHRHFVHVFRR